MDDRGSVVDRRAEDPKLTAMHKRINAIVERQTLIAEDVRVNTEITKRIETSTAGLVEAWGAISGGLKVLNFLGKCAKWVTIVVGAATALWTAWHLVGTPPAVDIPR